MKASELRIGNYITYYPEYPPIECGINDMLNPELILPIKLTEDLLLNFGFEKIDVLPGTIEYRFGYNKEMGKFSMRVVKFFSDEVLYYFNWKPTELKYVHQLQNLFYALTGEELKLN